MRHISLSLLFLFLFNLLLACATSPVSPENARNVPADRIYQTDLLVSEGSRTIPVTITRDTAFVGSAVNYILKIDGKRVAAFATGETLKIYLESGEYSFGVIVERSIFGISPIDETDVGIKEGGMNNFGLSTGPQHAPGIFMTPFSPTPSFKVQEKEF